MYLYHLFVYLRISNNTNNINNFNVNGPCKTQVENAMQLHS